MADWFELVMLVLFVAVAAWINYDGFKKFKRSFDLDD
jgi:hypothetical protein